MISAVFVSYESSIDSCIFKMVSTDVIMYTVTSNLDRWEMVEQFGWTRLAASRRSAVEQLTCQQVDINMKKLTI